MRRTTKTVAHFPEPNFGILDAHPELRLKSGAYTDVYGEVPECPYGITDFTVIASGFVPVPPSAVSTIDWDKMAAGKYTIPEMRSYAKSINISVPASIRKQELLELILAARSAR